jgi:hypothetical protein
MRLLPTARTFGPGLRWRAAHYSGGLDYLGLRVILFTGASLLALPVAADMTRRPGIGAPGSGPGVTGDHCDALGHCDAVWRAKRRMRS